MATIYNYLDKKRKENPYYKYLTYEGLYEKLKGSDANLPQWEQADKSLTQKRENLKSYQKQQSPSFANSLYEWTDWGIDDTDPNWVKEAYNNSITGLSYQFAEGKKKYKIDENYKPGILHDIGSMVLSFAMPMDIASMFVGGWIGKAGLAATGGLKSVQNQAVKKLVAGGMTKAQAAETVAKSLNGYTVDKITQEMTKGGLRKQIGARATVAQTARPIISGGALQGSTLATFEGVRGGMQAAVDGTDVWEGIGHGVMHGGIMGGAAGMVGASLNIVNSGLWAKAAERQLTASEKIARAATGAVGQVGAEATTFQAPEVYKVLTDENYSTQEFLRNYAVNIGMMGILKAKSKLIDGGMKEAEKWIKYQKEKKAKEVRDERERNENIEKDINEGLDGQNTPTETARLEANKKIQNDYLARNLKRKEVELEEFKVFETNTKKYKKIVDDYINKNKDPRKIDAPDYAGLMTHLRHIHDYMKQNLSHQQKDVTIKENTIKRLDDSINRWETEVFDRINNSSNAGVKVQLPTGVQANLEAKTNKYIRDALKEGDTTAIDLIRKGNEDFIKIEDGKVVLEKEIDYRALDLRIKAYESTKRKTKFEDIAEDKDVASKIQGIENVVELKSSAEISERIAGLETRILRETNIAKKEPLERERDLLKHIKILKSNH